MRASSTAWLQRLACLLVLVTTATGCAQRSGNDPGNDTGRGRFADVAADRIADDVFGAALLADLEFLHHKHRNECMADRGRPELARIGAEREKAPFASLNVRAPGFATLSESALRSRGFGEDLAAKRAHLVSYDAAYDRDLDECDRAAADELGDGFTELRSAAYEQMNAVTIEVGDEMNRGVNGERFQAIVSPLLTCLDRRGLGPAGAAPTDRTLESYGLGIPQGRRPGTDPPPPRRVPGTIEIVPPQPARRYRPTAAEAKLAVAARRCADRSGFAAEFVALRLDVVRQVVARHEQRLTEIRDRLAELHRSSAKDLPAG